MFSIYFLYLMYLCIYLFIYTTGFFFYFYLSIYSPPVLYVKELFWYFLLVGQIYLEFLC